MISKLLRLDWTHRASGCTENTRVVNFVKQVTQVALVPNHLHEVGTPKVSHWTRRFYSCSNPQAIPFTHAAKSCRPTDHSGNLHKSQNVSKSKQSVVSEIGMLASQKQSGGFVVRSANHCHKNVSEPQVVGSIFVYRHFKLASSWWSCSMKIHIMLWW